jgi:hypothetical protein
VYTESLHANAERFLESFFMWIKVIIVLLFVALVVSLFSGYVFLLKDKGSSNRTWSSLSVRLVLAALLMGFLIYGVYTGQLGSNAPWDARLAKPTAEPLTLKQAQ